MCVNKSNKIAQRETHCLLMMFEKKNNCVMKRSNAA